MTEIRLQELVSDSFYEAAGTITSALGMRRFLYKSALVSKLRSAIAGGVITENAIRDFVEWTGSHFQKGKQFPYELALSALAVALEERKTPFAEQFLLDLSRLNIIEMSISPKVARESIKRWYSLPRLKEKVRQFAEVAIQSRISQRHMQLWMTTLVAVRNRPCTRVEKFHVRSEQ